VAAVARTRWARCDCPLTDSPACGYDNVFVTVQKVRVHKSGSAADNDAGWSEVVLAAPQRVDLLTLTNGTLLPLGQTELPAVRTGRCGWCSATSLPLDRRRGPWPTPSSRPAARRPS
jgi:hypothetical protein